MWSNNIFLIFIFCYNFAKDKKNHCNYTNKKRFIMIQRKQTLYLLGAIFLILFNLFNPFIKSAQLTFDAFHIKQLKESAPIIIKTYPIAIYIIILALLHLFTIFLFKGRHIQMRFTMLSMILSLGFYGILFFYHYLANRQIAMNLSQYNFGLVSPLLAAIFDFMAYGGIKRDEKIVRDSERLR